MTTQAESYPACYDFSHDLLREAVTSQLSDIRRRLLHRRAAAMLAQEAALLPTTQRGPLAGRITRHALEGEAFHLIFQWAPVAAEHAMRLYAYADALAAYEAASMAFAQLRHDPTFDVVAHAQRQVEYLLQRLVLLSPVGRPLTQQETGLQEVVEWLARYPDAALEAKLYLRKAAYLNEMNDYEGCITTAQRAYEHHMNLGDELGAANSLYQAGIAQSTLSQNKAASHVLEQALALYQASGDTGGESLCLSALAIARLNLGEIEAALSHLARALDIARQQGDILGQARTCYVTALAWAYYYHAQNSEHFAQEALTLYRKMGTNALAARPLIFVGLAHDFKEELTQAQALCQQVFDQAQAYSDHWLEGWVAQLLGRLALARADIPAATHWLGHAQRCRQESGEVANQISDLVW
ncbi:MAG: hypothetical protein ACRD6I_18580, partial [Candidatus Acidiferrales bacterium]